MSKHDEYLGLDFSDIEVLPPLTLTRREFLNLLKTGIIVFFILSMENQGFLNAGEFNPVFHAVLSKIYSYLTHWDSHGFLDLFLG